MAMQKIQRVSAKRGANQPPRSRAFFLEMLLNMLIFALCSVVALQVFVEGKLVTNTSEALTELTLDATSLAETYKASDAGLESLVLYTADAQVKGEFNSNGVLVYYYDSEFEPTTASEAVHRLEITPVNSANNRVNIVVIAGYSGEEELFSLEVSQFRQRGGR